MGFCFPGLWIKLGSLDVFVEVIIQDLAYFGEHPRIEVLLPQKGIDVLPMVLILRPNSALVIPNSMILRSTNRPICGFGIFILLIGF